MVSILISVLASLAHLTLAAAQTQVASPQCGRWRGSWAVGVKNLLPSHSSEAQTHPPKTLSVRSRSRLETWPLGRRESHQGLMRVVPT